MAVWDALPKKCAISLSSSVHTLSFGFARIYEDLQAMLLFFFAPSISWTFMNHVSLNQGTHQNIYGIHPNAPEFTPQNHDPQQYLRGKENGEGCIDHLNRLNVDEMDRWSSFERPEKINTTNWSEHVPNGFRRTTALTLSLCLNNLCLLFGGGREEVYQWIGLTTSSLIKRRRAKEEGKWHGHFDREHVWYWSSFNIILPSCFFCSCWMTIRGKNTNIHISTKSGLPAWVRISHSFEEAVTMSSLKIPKSLPVFPPFTWSETAIHMTFAKSATAIIPELGWKWYYTMRMRWRSII